MKPTHPLDAENRPAIEDIAASEGPMVCYLCDGPARVNVRALFDRVPQVCTRCRDAHLTPAAA